MIIIIGLGNPGKQFENTRHNVGFNAINKIAASFQFPIFNFQSNSNAEISQSEISGKKVMLAKPQTFMNNSGSAVKKILSKIKDQISDLIIIHDDIDLPVGKIKIVKDRGSAGHKGVESIIKAIGNNGLVRIRIGINKPQISCTHDRVDKVPAKKIVLKKFSKQEKAIIDKAIQKTVNALGLFLDEGLEKTMNEYNK